MRIGTISVVKDCRSFAADRPVGRLPHRSVTLTVLLERPEVEVVPKIERNRIRQLLLINK